MLTAVLAKFVGVEIQARRSPARSRVGPTQDRLAARPPRPSPPMSAEPLRYRVSRLLVFVLFFFVVVSMIVTVASLDLQLRIIFEESGITRYPLRYVLVIVPTSLTLLFSLTAYHAAAAERRTLRLGDWVWRGILAVLLTWVVELSLALLVVFTHS